MKTISVQRIIFAGFLLISVVACSPIPTVTPNPGTDFQGSEVDTRNATEPSTTLPATTKNQTLTPTPMEIGKDPKSPVELLKPSPPLIQKDVSPIRWENNNFKLLNGSFLLLFDGYQFWGYSIAEGKKILLGEVVRTSESWRYSMVNGKLFLTYEDYVYMSDLSDMTGGKSFYWGVSDFKAKSWSISPDGAWIMAYMVDTSRKAYIASFEDNVAFSITFPVAKNQGLIWFPFHHPDGHLLSLIEHDQFGQLIKGSTLLLPNNLSLSWKYPEYYGESVSPDGHWLAWKESEGGTKDIGFDSEKIFLAPADCLLQDPFDCHARLQYLGTLPYSVGTELLWMPDSQGLVWSLQGPGDKPSMIGELSLDGSSRVWGSYYNIYPSSWSPDGEWLFAHAMLFTRDGRGVQLPEDIYSNVLGWFSVP